MSINEIRDQIYELSDKLNKENEYIMVLGKEENEAIQEYIHNTLWVYGVFSTGKRNYVFKKMNMAGINLTIIPSQTKNCFIISEPLFAFTNNELIKLY